MLGLLLLARWAANRAKAPGALGWFGRHVRVAWLGLIGLTVAGLALLVILNVPQGPLKSVCEKRYVSRVCTLFSTTQGTNAVRVLIWEGVVDMMIKPHTPIQTSDGKPDPLNVIRPLIGYGPESMWVAYNRFYPPDLAHYEARNASPDRSHNETFDSLVRGGFLQFGIQFFLYCSLFYHALRWLGLMKGRGRRNLFVALLIAGGALGVIVPLLADKSLRLAGIGLPAGLIIGMILYVTVDLLLSGGIAKKSVPTAEEAKATVASGRRQVLLLALFAAIVAHFAEVHFGIAIASTLTLFWVLAGTLVAVGMGWTDEEARTTAEVKVEAKTEVKVSAASAPAPATRKPQPAAAKAQPAGSTPGKRQATQTRVPPTAARHNRGRPARAPSCPLVRSPTHRCLLYCPTRASVRW